MTNYSPKNLWAASPARIVATVMAIVAVLATYGLNVVPDPDKFATALTLVLGLLAGGETIRANVYSPATVARMQAEMPDPGPKVTVTSTIPLVPTNSGNR